MHASVQETTSVDKFDTQLPQLAKFICVWRQRSTFMLIDIPYGVSQSLTNSENSQALQTLHRQNCHYAGASYLIRPARLVQYVHFVLQGTAAAQDSWLFQLEPTSVFTTIFILLLLQFRNGSFFCACSHQSRD